MRTKYQLLLAALLLGSFLVNLISYVQASPWTDEDGPWGEVVDEYGNIQYANLTDLGEIQVEADWMPDVPFIEGQATYHQYLTSSGNVVVLPSATTLFFMSLNPEESGMDDASYTLGNGLGVFETLLAGYVTPADLTSMGYTNAADFYQALIDGESNIFTFDFMGNFLWDLLTSSLADENIYTMLLLYTSGDCDAVPGGCPALPAITTPVAPPICPPAYIQTNPIQITGGSGQGGKIAPENPVVIGQDEERRGADIQVHVLIPPVVYHSFQVIPHTRMNCISDPMGEGEGCPDHPGNAWWKTEVEIWYECLEHTQVYPDYLSAARVSVSLTPASRAWILTDLAQAYPGAHLLHPDFSYSFSGPGTLLGDGSVTWTTIIERIQTADPGDYATSVTVRTSGNVVSESRQAQSSLGTFLVELVRVTLIEQP